MKTQINNTTLEFVKGDITQQETEAVVNAANDLLAPGGGVAGAIHRVAGTGLWDECKKLGGCATGEAKITSGHDLPASWIIHTVGPVYSGSSEDPEKLAECYRNSLETAKQQGVKSISFPALSTGAFGYPLEDAAHIAVQTVIEFLNKDNSLELVRFVLFDDKSLQVHEKIIREQLDNSA